MNVNPTTYPVQQMSQQLPYGQPSPTPRPPLHIQPQQSPVQNHFFHAPFPPNNGPQPLPQHHQQQHHQHHQQQPPPPPSPQHFPQQQPYHQFHHPSQSFYGNPHPSGNGLMPGSAPQVSPQAHAPPSGNRPGITSSVSAPHFKPSEPSHSGTSPQQSNSMAAPAAPPPLNNPLSQRSSAQNGGLAQHPQSQNPLQAQGLRQAQSNTPQPQSPQSITREKTRVSVLLEINAYLLQEVVSLQAQGKAGGPPVSLPQQSPTHDAGAGSPSSTTDPSNPLNNSPIDPSKPTGAKPPSQEYIECMRRLQANLAYLAAIADAKKKAAGSIPAAPAIMAPPSHLSEVRDLYKRLSAMFPGASQSGSNRTMPMPGTQMQNTG